MPVPDLEALTLPRSRKIKHGRDFARAKIQGLRMAKGCLVANWFELPPGAQSRVGVITSKRLGKATRRNRARRLLREAFRLNQHRLAKPLDMILIARQSISGRLLRDVEHDYLTVLRRNGLLNTADNPEPN